jgi:hypothetical protein
MFWEIEEIIIKNKPKPTINKVTYNLDSDFFLGEIIFKFFDLYGDYNQEKSSNERVSINYETQDIMMFKYDTEKFRLKRIGDTFTTIQIYSGNHDITNYYDEYILNNILLLCNLFTQPEWMINTKMKMCDLVNFKGIEKKEDGIYFEYDNSLKFGTKHLIFDYYSLEFIPFLTKKVLDDIHKTFLCSGK